MKINSIQLNINGNNINKALNKNSKFKSSKDVNSSNPPQINTLSDVFYYPVGFERKYQGKNKPDNVIKALTSAIKYNEDKKAVNILCDFYKANGGYSSIINNPKLNFTPLEANLKDNSKEENYSHNYLKNYNQELLLGENKIAYREGKNIYSVDINKKDKNPSLEINVNNKYLLNAFCAEINTKLQNGETQSAAKTMQDFWIKNNGFNSIKNMMGRKRGLYYTKEDKKPGFRINLDSGVLLAEENKLKFYSNKRNAELDMTPKIIVEFNKDNDIEVYEAQGYFSDCFGIIHSYCCDKF